MKESYQEWNPGKQSCLLVEHVNQILEEYREQGYKLTLRQLYYQLVSRDIIPNLMKEYMKIGNVVSRGRLAGLIDWDMIEDRVRVPQERTHWSSPKEIVEAAARSYYRSRWERQRSYIEVWCEKDAVSNIIQPVCHEWDVTFMANRGYSSQSAMYEGSKRLYAASIVGKTIGVLYLGDHDPSGIDMTRDIRDRLGVFLEEGRPFGNVDRLALNMDQVRKYQPPENPAKVTDSRFKGYCDVYGQLSWELDALEPSVLSQLVEDAIKEYVDIELWEEVEEEESDHRGSLMEIAGWVGRSD